jgi:hypothetical protein
MVVSAGAVVPDVVLDDVVDCVPVLPPPVTFPPTGSPSNAGFASGVNGVSPSVPQAEARRTTAPSTIAMRVPRTIEPSLVQRSLRVKISIAGGVPKCYGGKRTVGCPRR